MAFLSFAAALKRDGSVEVLYAGTDGGAAVEAMEKAFTEADPAEVAEVHCIRNAKPFARRFLQEPVEPKAEKPKVAKPKPAKSPKVEKPKESAPKQEEQVSINTVERDPFAE